MSIWTRTISACSTGRCIMNRNQNEESHRAEIVDQFSRQAIPFAQVPGHLDATQILVELSGVTSDDQVLDVACGPGIVSCEFARHARQVTGVDLTPAMIEQAQKRQRELNLDNVGWAVGDAVPLPYPDNSFSLVLTRYSFHHLLDPQQALSEMIRVCKPGGRIMVADVAIDAAKGEAYDRLEILRDPSHIHALTTEEFAALFRNSGLVDCCQTSYGVDIELEAQMRASFPREGDEIRVRQMIIGDIGVDSLGINARRQEGSVVYTVPIAVYIGRKIDGDATPA
jgi:ubiquinone/menaquinone biosynthesis C-methylase UbiE